mgnify:CR=1 FL=1
MGFTLFIDQDKIGWRYGELLNLCRAEEGDEPVQMLSFSSDFLVKKGYREDPGVVFSPQFDNIALVTDMRAFFEMRAMRRNAIDQFWPSLERAETHRLRDDRVKFDKELCSISADGLIRDYGSNSMIKNLAHTYEVLGALYLPKGDSRIDLVRSRIIDAINQDSIAFEELKVYYHTNGRVDQLHGQVRSLYRQWTELFSFFDSLEVLDFLKDPEMSLSDGYTLSEKPIDRLKAFYSDCFETIGRMTVIAASLEGIISGAGFGVPTRRRLIPTAEFELVANGSKPDLISSMPFWPIIAGVFDSKLRNGIGHHSWVYDPVTDEIRYENHSSSRGREEFSVPYLDFCIQTRRIFHATLIMVNYVNCIYK